MTTKFQLSEINIIICAYQGIFGNVNKNKIYSYAEIKKGETNNNFYCHRKKFEKVPFKKYLKHLLSK